MLVEDAVVGQEVLAIDAFDLALRADEGRVREVPVERRAADERDRLRAGARDLVDCLAGSAHEAGPKQQVLRRVSRDCELREDDEVGGRPLRLRHRAHDPLDVPVEVADDDVELRERDPHRGIVPAFPSAGHRSFRLTVTNVTLAACPPTSRPSRSTAATAARSVPPTAATRAGSSARASARRPR